MTILEVHNSRNYNKNKHKHEKKLYTLLVTCIQLDR